MNTSLNVIVALSMVLGTVFIFAGGNLITRNVQSAPTAEITPPFDIPTLAPTVGVPTIAPPAATATPGPSPTAKP